MEYDKCGGNITSSCLDLNLLKQHDKPRACSNLLLNDDNTELQALTQKLYGTAVRLWYNRWTHGGALKECSPHAQNIILKEEIHGEGMDHGSHELMPWLLMFVELTFGP
jgi:hypothetical protein